MAKRRADKVAAPALRHGDLVSLPGGRVGEWLSIKDQRSTFRTEHFRCVDSLGLLLRNRTITGEMHDAGQDFARTFVAAHLDSVGTLRLDGLPRSAWQDSIPERRAWARKRIGQALDAVGGIASPGGCAVWHVAGMGRSIKEWSGVAGWNGRILNQYEAKGILVAALGMLAVHYGYSKPSRDPIATRAPLDD